MKKRICLVYTGGTIGMEEVQHEEHPGTWIRRPPADASSFHRIAPEILSYADVSLVYVHVPNGTGGEKILNKDSCDITPEDWTLIARTIYERKDEYDGFVVAHGTDTMHFTASAIAFAFGPELNFPIVFTGAQTTAFVPHGDARINLVRAVKVATEGISEVVICFGNHVFRACRTQKRDEKKFDAFESPSFFPLADITEEVIWHPSVGRSLGKQESNRIEFKPDFELGLIQLSLVPGMIPGQFIGLLDNDIVNGIILQSFGAGHLPFDGQFSFEGFIRKAVDNHIPVVVVSPFKANSTLQSAYESGLRAREMGVIMTGNMTNAAAVVKFRWVLSQVNSAILRGDVDEDSRIYRIAELMNSVYVGEMDIASHERRIERYV